MQRVINFSGGKTSAYMTIMEYKPGDIVLFTDTGREHPKTYKFIHDFEAFEGIDVIKISFKRNKNPFSKMLEDRGYKTLPNRMRRFCTESLKVLTARRYMVSIGIKNYENLIGFRYDEEARVKRHKEKLKCVQTKFPLYEQKVTKAIVNAFWETQPYDLEIPGILGNCTLCFMKGKNAIISILMSYPELADVWIEDEERNVKKGHTYLPNISIRQLRDIAQNNLFKGYDLTEIKPAFNCACTT